MSRSFHVCDMHLLERTLQTANSNQSRSSLWEVVGSRASQTEDLCGRNFHESNLFVNNEFPPVPLSFLQPVKWRKITFIHTAERGAVTSN
jgi:hypothetical protein